METTPCEKRPASPSQPPAVGRTSRITKLRGDLGKLTRQKRGARLHELMVKALRPCPSALAVWEAQAGALPKARLTALRDKLPAALLKCGGRASDDELLSLLHVLAVTAPADRVVVAEVRLDPARGDPRL